MYTNTAVNQGFQSGQSVRRIDQSSLSPGMHIACPACWELEAVALSAWSLPDEQQSVTAGAEDVKGLQAWVSSHLKPILESIKMTGIQRKPN